MDTRNVIAITGLIGAITGILWPVIAVGVLFAFRGPAMRALNRVSDDGGTIEVFGVKLNVGKATEEQQRMIEDLQKQVGTLRDAARVQGEIGQRASGFLDPSTSAGRVIAAPPRTIPPAPLAQAPSGGEIMVGAVPSSDPTPPIAVGSANPAALAPLTRSSKPRLLWVDDHPENVALLRASLRSRGFVIVEASSTEVALDAFGSREFDAVISDMGRDTADAGVSLAARIRGVDANVPIFIFCSIGAVRIYGGFAKQAGATLVTDSATLLMERLLELQSLG
ncbi:response regulator [Glacieibacterium megasporae]|uniref:response regulator n=1 Tax=Glacieibacterium megasporae TaxID=2835787 RepID=UPI001C1E3DA9|nr:response regulator [Polymorphobacter megasporae]UAJ10932.1 response regulator [Polymorphobacter megasporae]